MRKIREGIYRHDKETLCRVICQAKNAETLEEMVVCQDAFDESKCWAYPLSVWREDAEIGGEERPRFQFLASSMDELDEKPLFRLIEIIKDNMEQYDHFGERNVLRFYHRRTGGIVTVEEAVLGLAEDGEDTDGYDSADVVNAEKLLSHWNDYLRLPDDDINEYEQMKGFIDKLPVPYQNDMERAIHGKGAFRRFKDAAARFGVLDDWYRYLQAAYRREAREWCDANGIAWWRDLNNEGRL